ncbi:MAG: YkgJ family cysteine cluster protein [Desulfuromonadales bacterium]|nr:YkgJ family cysteine cluster protein [Desulfuromonadales bacterium]
MQELLASYQRLLAAADAWFARCQQVLGEQVRCTAGCTGCCRGLFDITLLDALALQQAFDRLPEGQRKAVAARADLQIAALQQRWPTFGPPYLLNDLPHRQWETPLSDETPCSLLGPDGVCLVYAGRPLTCRLHGLPQVDHTGEIFDEEGCTLNLPAADPLRRPELRGEFRPLFAEEARLLRQLAARLGRPGGEIDTYIPTALFIDFRRPPLNIHWS